MEGLFQRETAERKCPADAEPLQRHEVFRDKSAQKELLALVCFCSNKARGCQWRGPLAKLQNHSDAECPFSEVKCLKSHPYPQALFRCSFSSMGCDFHGPKESLVEHLSSHTAEHLTLSETYIKDISERVKNLQEQLDASLELNQAYEAQLSMQNKSLARVNQTLSVHQVKLERVEENLAEQRKSIDELRKSVETMMSSKEGEKARKNSPDVFRSLDFQDVRSALLDDEVVRRNRGRHPSRGQTRACEQVSMPYVNDNDHLVDPGERPLTATLHEIQLCDQDLKLQNLETASCHGSFLWKIDEFYRRFRESVEGEIVSINSPPFYTERYGYKLCARVCLSGDGLMGKDKYMSLFIVVMQGEYDALLSWPFQQKITLKLLDQGGIWHVTETFRPDPNSPSFQRPRSEMNVASGCPTFCSLHLLRSRGYVRDDAVFVKIMWAALGR